MVLLGLCWIYSSPWGGLTFSDTEPCSEWRSVYTPTCLGVTGRVEALTSAVPGCVCSEPREDRRKGGLLALMWGGPCFPLGESSGRATAPVKDMASLGAQPLVCGWACGAGPPWAVLAPGCGCCCGGAPSLDLDTGVCVSSQRLADCMCWLVRLPLRWSPAPSRAGRGRPGEGPCLQCGMTPAHEGWKPDRTAFFLLRMCTKEPIDSEVGLGLGGEGVSPLRLVGVGHMQAEGPSWRWGGKRERIIRWVPCTLWVSVTAYVYSQI